jgi:hypothetical protein
MPYFFILPVYVILLIVLVGTAVVARFILRFRPASGYLVGGAIGTLIGFVFINVVVMLAGVAPAWLAQKFTFPDWLRQVSKYLAAGTLLIGPFIASALGVLIGFAAGIYYVYRGRKRAACLTMK